MKTLSLTLPLLLLISINISAQSLKTKYDRFSNETTVSIGPDYVDIKGARLELAFYVASKGSQITGDKLIIGMEVYSSTRSWRFLSDDYLIMLLDGKRLEIGKPIARDPKITRHGVSEFLGYDISANDLRAISKASKVEMQIGRTKFTLREKFVKRIGELVAALPK